MPARAGDPPGLLGGTLLGLPGVGPVTCARLAEGGLSTIGDVLFFPPRAWEDLRRVVPVGELRPGMAQVTEGVVEQLRVIPAFRRRVLELILRGDDGQKIAARWFRFRTGMKERLEAGTRLRITGVPRPVRGALAFVHPETERVAGCDGSGGELRVRYSEIQGVPGRTVERLCEAACLRFVDAVPDGIPPEIAASLSLPGQAEALRALHLPEVTLAAEELAALNAGVAPAQRRLIFDELFFLQLGILRRRAEARRGAAPARIGSIETGQALDRFLAALPFAITRAQAEAIAEIRADLSGPQPMHRLLQGDVGAGKTVVAWAACELSCAVGQQAAIMAPTELLAEQHARTLGPWAASTGRSLGLLSASTSATARTELLEGLATGGIDVVVGTHALLQDRVGFSRLGLVVIDEQHRFGVAQRARLRDKGLAGASPHLLVMTATPIPRTLALTVYGDLDVSLMRGLPPGRQPPTTRVLRRGARGRALAALREALEEGRQAYWVCPLVEDSEQLELASVTRTGAELAADLEVPVGVVHGRMPAAERERVMDAFRSGSLSVLVATTVIEVGVDVPRASLMVIEGAERFGLSQLHQLRGRIGRGGGRSTCLVLSSEGGGASQERLEVMARTSDGFEVAEADLRLRGPGELYGTRQAGLLRLRFADPIRDLALLEVARREAAALLERDPELRAPGHVRTREVLESRLAGGRLFAEEAG